jgi:glycine/D-amino acid oxidase-like deaminating enzyme
MYDYLIMGQGLAGSLLAWELSRRGRKVCVIDNGHRHASSWVAAGLINPVTGLRMVKSPHTEAWLQAAGETYAELEQVFGLTLRHHLPMWRLFTREKQREAWQERLADPAYADYLGPVQTAEQAGPYQARHGFGVVNHTGNIDTKALLSEIRTWLQGQGAYVEKEVDYAEIRLEEGSVRWGELSAPRLIFCEGWRGVDNPWFGHLPLTPVKGEILTLQHAGELPEVIANFGKWLRSRRVSICWRPWMRSCRHRWRPRWWPTRWGCDPTPRTACRSSAPTPSIRSCGCSTASAPRVH